MIFLAINITRVDLDLIPAEHSNQTCIYGVTASPVMHGLCLIQEGLAALEDTDLSANYRKISRVGVQINVFFGSGMGGVEFR
jgi:hypothetical protein